MTSGAIAAVKGKPRNTVATAGRVSDEVAAAVRAKIQEGHYIPGEWLREVRLCAAYGVSRSTVRQALRRLADDGLVKLEENRGAFVASTTMQEVFDLFEVRAALYGLAARFACIRGTPEILSEVDDLIGQILDEMSTTRADDRVRISEAIFSKLAATASVDAQSMIEAIRRKTRWHLSYGGLEGTLARPIESWLTLRAGLSARDADRASEGARNVLYFVQEHVIRLMASRRLELAPCTSARRDCEAKSASSRSLD